MAIVVAEHFTRGGKTLLDFLTFCVMSYRMPPLFAYLITEYRIRPTPDGALVLFDNFCAPRAPARLEPNHPLLPPVNVRFRQEVETMRARLHAFRAGSPAPAEESGALPAPPVQPAAPKYLFDFILADFAARPLDPVTTAGEAFDPTLSPAENLPGRRMNEGQRAFVENVWHPRVRPALVGAGFWKISNVG